MATAAVVRAFLARSWVRALLIAAVAIWLVWFFLTVPGCGSGSGGVGPG